MAEFALTRWFANTFPGARAAFAPPSEPKAAQLKKASALVDPSRLISGWELQPYNPSWLVTRKGLAIYDQMRRDEQVKAALRFKKDSVLAAGWEIVSPPDEEEDWEVTRFVRDSLTHVDRGWNNVLQGVLGALDYGYSVQEKIFKAAEDGEWKGKLILSKVNSIKPHYLDFVANEYGELQGISQQLAIGAGKTGDLMPPGKFIIYTNQFEFGNYYGTADLESAYRPWWVKDNAYKWLAVALERYGMPPLFLFYDPQGYQGNQIEELKKIVKNIQNATMGVIPRSTPASLEFWSQELGGQSSKIFLEALQRFDEHIARALLVPSMLGVSSDEGKTGSLARSQEHAESFLRVLLQLQQDISVTVMNSQVIPQLCDLNWPNLESYPEFRFLPFTDEKRLEVMTAWAGLVSGKVVNRVEDDEVHIRKVLGFPENEAVVIEELPADALNKAKMEALKKGQDPNAADGGGDGGKSAFGKKFEFDPTQPRDGQGRWAVSGDDGVLHTSDVEAAARALQEGRTVELQQPIEVAYLLDQLGKECAECVEKGEAAKPLNLCNISLKGTNLFCVLNKGVPRVQMPQLAGNPLVGSKAALLPRDPVYGGVDLAPQFKTFLEGRGVKVDEMRELVAHLRSTQNELDGRKVAAVGQAILQGKLQETALFVSRENYIIDGHHRWAGTVGAAALQGNLESKTIAVSRVNMGILEVLKEARAFAQEWGIPQTGMAKYAYNPEQTRAPKGDPQGGQWVKEQDPDPNAPQEYPIAHDQVPKEIVEDIENLSMVVFKGVDGKEEAGDLVAALGAHKRKDLLKILDDTAKDGRTYVLLHRGDEAKGIPTVWLLGWSRTEGTDLHDHGASEVGVHVLRGKISEKAFVSEATNIGAMRSAAQSAVGASAFLNERQFRAGSTMTIAAPYVHDVFGTGTQHKSDATVHAYWPPLREMGYYQREGNQLKYDGMWKEGYIDPDAARRHTHQHTAVVSRAQLIPVEEYTEAMQTFAEEHDAVWVAMGDESVAVNAADWDESKYKQHLKYSVVDWFETFGFKIPRPADDPMVDDGKGNKGLWRTMNGRRVFIRGGESPIDALHRSIEEERASGGKGKTSTVESKTPLFVSDVMKRFPTQGKLDAYLTGLDKDRLQKALDISKDHEDADTKYVRGRIEKELDDRADRGS